MSPFTEFFPRLLQMGSWSPIPYSIEPRLFEYQPESRRALHLDPSI